jgi:HD superfamily phosphohydrolase
MTEAIEVLRSKGVAITDDEAQAVSIAILLHDIGHGPFSHTLEHAILNVHHEELSICFMEQLNLEFSGQLETAIRIFRNEYPRKFFHQLVSGQLDMDRMDYLNRDSYFTGVSEGVIGFDRIIKMLAVQGDELVVEEKGIYSIEKFLIARRLMYWQVYLHKTVLVAEQMLVKTLQRAKELAASGAMLDVSPSLKFFLYNNWGKKDLDENRDGFLSHFAKLDDYDIMFALKGFMEHEDPILAYLATCLVNRRLFRIELSGSPVDTAYMDSLRSRILSRINLPADSLPYLLFHGEESNHAYNTTKDEIKILYKNGNIIPISQVTDFGLQTRSVTKYWVCYPKWETGNWEIGN